MSAGKTWKTSLAIALLLEVPLFFFLVASSSKGTLSSGLTSAVVWLHVISLSIVSFVFLRIFGHGQPSVGSITLWHLGYWGFVFIVQLVLTMLFVAVVLKLLSRKEAEVMPG